MIAPGDVGSSLLEGGWALLLPADADGAVRRSLEPLLEHRERQARGRFRIFEGGRGYRGESVSRFLSRCGVAAGTVNPDRVPYYLLIAASPEQVPFGIERQLSDTYAVGRVWFDELDAFRRYADRVVRSERGGAQTDRRAALFATRHPGDPSTEATAQFLLGLIAELVRTSPQWRWSRVIGPEATRARLQALLEECPPVQVVAAHAALFDEQSPGQDRFHGALVCQDWGGPAVPGPVSRDAVLGADDVPRATRPGAGVAVLWASCSAGAWPGWQEERLRPRPSGSVAALPQRLLSGDEGGPLAILGFLDPIVGHPVGRDVYSHAYGEALMLFLRALLEGRRVGDAMRPIRLAQAGVSREIARTSEQLQSGAALPDAALAGLSLAAADLRAVTLLGDPAVRAVPGGAGEEESS